MEKVNILMGRFQPITMGHIKCAETAWKEKGVKTILLIVDTTKEDAKHPFATTMLISTYKKLNKEFDYIADVIVVKSADIVKNIELCREAGYEPISWSCGTDRVDSYKKMIAKYGPQIGLADDFEVIEIKRSDDDISATQVRNALLKGDTKTFEKLTPKSIHSLYSKLKKNVDMYCELKEGVVSLYDYLVEKMGWNDTGKMDKIYNGQCIVMKIKKQTPNVINILDICDDVCNDSYMTKGEVRWYFSNSNEMMDTWGKIQKALHIKSDDEIDIPELNIYLATK